MIRYKTIIRILVLVFIGIIFYYLFFHRSAKNYDTALIEKSGDKYKMILIGERNYMAHDPISVLKRETYMDVFIAIIPRKSGIIKGEELPTKKGNYKVLGTINIVNDDKVIVDLYYDNYTDKIKDPLGWNGEYKIKWIEAGDYVHY